MAVVTPLPDRVTLDTQAVEVSDHGRSRGHVEFGVQDLADIDGLGNRTITQGDISVAAVVDEVVGAG